MCIGRARYPAIPARPKTGGEPDWPALGALCGLSYAAARQTRIRVWAAMVAAVLVSRPQKV